MQNLVCGLLAALCFSQLSALAQTQFVLTFKGTCLQTNAAGVMVSQALTERTWLAEAAQRGNNDPANLGIVYHVEGNPGLGDTIDVVNLNTGETLGRLFGFYFGEAFGRMALMNRNGTQIKRLDYVYTDQNDHALGSSLTSKRFFVDRSGRTRRVMFTGQMQYIVTPDSSHGLKVCRGTFTASQPFVKRQ